MKRTFRANKMLKRLKEEGRLGEVRTQDLELIMKLDGKVGDDYNWQSVVRDEPLVWIPADGDQDGTYVNIKDCD